MQIKATIRYLFTFTKVAKIKKNTVTSIGCGEIGIPIDPAGNVKWRGYVGKQFAVS